MKSPRLTNRKRQIFGALALLVVSISFALFVGEFTLRLIHSDVTTTGDNKSFYAKRWYREHPPIFNKLGFREEEILKKSAGTYRIAVIGDSLTFGQGIPENDRFSNLLQSDLSRGEKNYEVLNFGRPGAETHHHQQILNEFVLAQGPDFILLQWFVNDVEISHAGRDRTSQLVPLRRLSKWLHTHSALYFLLNRRWASAQRSLGYAEDYVVNMRNRFEDPSSVESQTASAALVDFVESIKESNVPMGIVLFPLLVDVEGDPAAYPLGFLFDRVLVTCAEQEIDCLDLRPVFAQVAQTSDLWVNRYDKHPGAIANKLAYDAIRDKFGPLWLEIKGP